MEQQNEHTIHFPEVMKGKTILYVHGFGSSGQSGTVSLLRRVLPGSTVVAPDLPIHPAEALDLLKELCRQAAPSLVIGTSMGGMYAEQLYGYDRILVNPAFGIADTMSQHGLTGKQQFHWPRQDGVQEFYVDKPLVKEYRAVCLQSFAHADDEGEQCRVTGLFGDADPVVDTLSTFSSHYAKAIRFHGGHRLCDHSMMHAVMPVIRWVDDRQERRERPIVYVDVGTLIDKWQKPHSSSQKTIRILIEQYRLYFVAPAPASSEKYAEVLAWLYEYVGVPAYGHTVFTNQKELLYGDYLVDAAPTEGMATLLRYGSDTFKTWDDIAEYFSRLGGQ